MARVSKTRRRLLKAAAGIPVAGALTGCISGGGGSSAGNGSNGGNGSGSNGSGGGNAGSGNNPYGEITGPFRLRMWHEKYGNQVIEEFASEWNIQATNKGFSDPSNPYSQIQAGQYAGDNISFIHNWGQRAWKNDMLQKIDTSSLQHFDKLDDRWQDMNQVDGGGQWGIPYDVGIFPLTYNKDEFSSTPNRWDLLWNSDYKGRITMQDSAVNSCQLAALYTGQDPLDPDDFQDIEEALKQQKPLVKAYWGTFERGMRLFVDDAVDVGQLTVGRTVQAAVENGANVDYTVPKSGAMTYFDEFTIPKNAKNVATSHAWIDRYLQNGGPLFTKLEKYRATTQNLDANLPKKLSGWYEWPDNWKLKTQELLEDRVREKYDSIWTRIQG